MMESKLIHWNYRTGVIVKSHYKEEIETKLECVLAKNGGYYLYRDVISMVKP